VIHIILRASIALFLTLGPTFAADVALVDDELGQAVLFENRGLCYAVLPNHVSSRKNRIALAVPQPAQTGVAEIFWRDPENDLAMAFVEGDLASRCQLDLETLVRSLSNTLQRNESGLIKSVHFGGAFFDRLGANLIDVDDRFVTVRITDDGVDAEVMQGLSGAMLSVDGTIVGIAIDAASSSEARFLRMDVAAGLVARNLSNNHPDTRPIAQAQTGLGFRVTGFEAGQGAGVVTLEPDDLAEPWIADWPGAPMAFEITLSQDALLPVNRIQMASILNDAHTPPRQIMIELDRGLPGNAYWTRIAASDMSPTGVFDLKTGGTVARRIRITFQDVWTSDRPVRLDRLVVE
jgi:hypothetical protein